MQKTYLLFAATIVLGVFLHNSMAAKQKNSWWTKRSLFPASSPSVEFPDTSSVQQVNKDPTQRDAAPLYSQGKETDIATVYSIFSPCFTHLSQTQTSPCLCIFHQMLDFIARGNLQRQNAIRFDKE